MNKYLRLLLSVLVFSLTYLLFDFLIGFKVEWDMFFAAVFGYTLATCFLTFFKKKK